MPGRKQSRVAGCLREADQEQRDRRDPDGRVVILKDGQSGKLRRRQAARDVADEIDAVRSEVEGEGDDQSGRHEDERTGYGGSEKAEREDQSERPDAHDYRRPVHVAERPHPGCELT